MPDLPTSRMFRRFSPSPTMNNRKLIPISENVVRPVELCSKFKKFGLSNMPEKRYPIMIGWRRARIIPHMINVNIMIILSSTKA